MNRRKFLKAMLGTAVAAIVPGCKFPAGPTESIAVDMAKPGADKCLFAEFGRYESVRFIESTPEGRNSFYDEYKNAIYSNSKWDVPVQEQGGFMYSDELSETLRGSLKPVNSYYKTPDFIQDELNKLRNKQIDNMALVTHRKAGRTYSNNALNKLIRDLNESFI